MRMEFTPTFINLITQVQTEADAYKLIEDMRWGPDREHQTCPKCGSDRKFYFIKPSDGGETRKTNRGTATQRRRWKCADCRHQFSVTVDTIFHGSKVPLKTWLLIISEMCTDKNGISAREIERKYNLTAKTAWYVTHRIREAMKRDPVAGLLSGRIQVDETLIGGKTGNMHNSVRNPKKAKPVEPGERKGGPLFNKQIVVSLISEETGEVRSKVVPDVTANTLEKALSEELDLGNVQMVTDEMMSYKTIANRTASHETVNHKNDEYFRVEDDGTVVTTNPIEAFFSQLKRSVDGTHHHISKEHLHRYLAEHDFRYSTRDLSDAQRMTQLMQNVGGRRLSWRPLTQG